MSSPGKLSAEQLSEVLRAFTGPGAGRAAEIVDFLTSAEGAEFRVNGPLPCARLRDVYPRRFRHLVEQGNPFADQVQDLLNALTDDEVTFAAVGMGRRGAAVWLDSSATKVIAVVIAVDRKLVEQES